MKTIVLFLMIALPVLSIASGALAWQFIASGGGTTRARACADASVQATSVCSGQRADVGECTCDQTNPTWWECSLPYDCRSY